MGRLSGHMEGGKDERDRSGSVAKREIKIVKNIFYFYQTVFLLKKSFH